MLKDAADSLNDIVSQPFRRVMVKSLALTAAELDRLKKEIAKVENALATVRRKLGNQSFVANAPAAVVQEHRQRETDWAEKLSQLARMRESLEG